MSSSPTSTVASGWNPSLVALTKTTIRAVQETGSHSAVCYLPVTLLYQIHMPNKDWEMKIRVSQSESTPPSA